MKKLVICIVIIIGCCFNGFSYINPQNNENVSEGISPRDVFGYTYVGVLSKGGSSAYIWKKYGNYYWTYGAYPESTSEFKSVYKDDYGYYYIIDYYGDKTYLKNFDHELVRNLEQEAYNAYSY